MGRFFLACLLATALAAGCTLDRAGLIDPAGGGSPAQGGSPATGGAGPGPTTTQGGGPTTSVGGSPPGTENCLNGVDDDGDDLIDCADDDCTLGGYVCVPAVAAIEGYVARVASTGDCSTDTEALTLNTCQACTCVASPGTCDVEITLYSDAQCNDSINTRSPGDGCSTGPNGARWADFDNLAPNNDGSCAPADDEVEPAASAACLAEQVGACDDMPNHVCAPASSGVDPRCVLVVEGSQCSGPYTERIRVFEGALDHCACGCNAGSQSCGDAVVNYNTANSCPAPLTTIVNGCTSLGNISAWSVETHPATLPCSPTVSPVPSVAAKALCCIP